MKVIHRVSISDEAGRRDVLASLDVSFNTPDSPLVRTLWFDIEESHPEWEQVRQLILKWNAGDIVQTKFTLSELNAARFLQMLPAQHLGYPQPEDDFGYLAATYDVRCMCPACGMGKIQVAPFRMKGEPHWGKKQILQLNWVFDEFFVLPQVWEDVFRPLGIGRSDVLDHRTGKPLQNVVQLVITDVAQSPLAITDYASEICAGCGRKRYFPICRGYFPSFAADPGSHVCKTQEVFGSGTSAWNVTVVGSDVYRTMQSQNLAGVAFAPLKNKVCS